jgi:predicted TIM-barrel fold metal-dependent hydrolase
MYFINLRPAPPIDFLRTQIQNGVFRVFGEITIQYAGIEPTDPAFEPYVALAEEMDVPLGVHVGPGPPGAPYVGSPNYRARLHSPLLYEELLVRHPNLRLYLICMRAGRCSTTSWH